MKTWDEVVWGMKGLGMGGGRGQPQPMQEVKAGLPSWLVLLAR